MRNKLLALLVAILSVCMLSFAACTFGSDETSTPDSTPGIEDTGSGDTGSGDTGTGGGDELDAEFIQSVPESALNISATMDADEAKSAWFIVYGEEGLEVTVYVTDAVIYTAQNVYASDGIMINVTKEQRVKGYSDKTLSVTVSAEGDYTVRNLATGTAVEETNVEVSATKFTLDNQTVAGYYVTVVIPYEETEVVAGEKNAAVAIALTNASKALKVITKYEASYNVDYQNVHTYMAVTDDNAYATNQYLDFGGVWGDGGYNLKASPAWVLDGDDDSEGANIYSTDYLGDDSYVYMHKSNVTHFYAEAQINVTSLLNGEMWGKFGLTVTSADGESGFFYYVDATAADGKNFDNGAVTLGCNDRARAGAGGWEGNWRAVGNMGGTSAQYTGENYVTLGIYRENNIFKLFANGREISAISPNLDNGEIAYVGIACFNMTLRVKNYKLITDEEALKDFEVQTQEVDYLFMGDSYVDTAFWYTYNQTVELYDMNAVNVGVGGTQVEDWLSRMPALKQQYKAKNVIVHIGVNDIDTDETTAVVIGELNTLFGNIKSNWEGVNIYYLGLVDNMMFPAKWADYAVINEYVKGLAASDAQINYIDMPAVITKNAANSTMSWFNADGLHYGVDGYAIWTKEILKALGITRPVAEGGVGDVEVEGAPAFAYSGGWSFENGVAHNYGANEAQIFVNGLYATDFYGEVKLSINGNTGVDAYPKAGLAVRTTEKTFFWAIDAIGGNTTIKTTVTATRNDVINRNWVGWPVAGEVTGDYNEGNYLTMGIAKVGADLYLLSNGTLVNVFRGEFNANDKAALSVFNFNMEMFVKDGYFTTDAEEIYAKLPVEHAIAMEEYEGVTATFTVEEEEVTAAKAGQMVTIALEKREGKIIESVMVNGVVVEANAEGAYVFKMPFANANITLSISGLYVINTAAVAGKVTVSAENVEEGSELIITPNANWIVKKLMANGAELEANEEGKYVMTVTEPVTLTGEFVYTADGINVDGEKEAAYGTANKVAEYEDNRSITVYSVKTASGVAIYFVAVMNTTKTDAAEWFNNTNVEFYLNGNRGAQRFVNINGETNGVAAANWTTVQLENGKYQYTVEVFVEKSKIDNWSDEGNVSLNFAWKTAGETGRALDAIHAYCSTGTGDWFSRHKFGGCDLGANDFTTGFAAYGTLPANLFITANGTMTYEGTAANATIDGNLTEYAEKSAVTVGDASKAQAKISGMAASDGLYLAVTVTHGAWGAYEGAWHLNDNLEFRINDANAIVVWLNGQMNAGAFFTDAKCVTVAGEDGKQITTVELWAKGAANFYRLELGITGNGFGGWQPAIWDGRCIWITANGAVEQDPLAAQTEVVLDGKFDDAVWTEEVKSKVFSANFSTAKVSVIGVNVNNGVLLGFTVNHKVAPGAVVRADANTDVAGDWWHCMGPELRLGGTGWQVAASSFDNGRAINCLLGFATQQNEDGTYTTYFEMLVEYGKTRGCKDSRINLAIGGNWEDRFYHWIDNWGVACCVTANGLENL